MTLPPYTPVEWLCLLILTVVAIVALRYLIPWLLFLPYRIYAEVWTFFQFVGFTLRAREWRKRRDMQYGQPVLCQSKSGWNVFTIQSVTDDAVYTSRLRDGGLTSIDTLYPFEPLMAELFRAGNRQFWIAKHFREKEEREAQEAAAVPGKKTE